MIVSYNEVIDLTIPIVPGLDILPTGLKKSGESVDFHFLRTMEKENVNVGIYHTPIHAGTHLDVPAHVIPDGKVLQEYTLDHWMGMGYCVDVSHVKPNEEITVDMLKPYEEEIRKGSVAVIYSGWNEKMFPKLEYWDDSPSLSAEAARWLVVDCGIKLLGYDFFQEAAAKGYRNDPRKFVEHQAVLTNGALHIEHLTNTSKIVGSHFFFMALPLNILNAEGSPTRAVALR